MLHGWGNRRRRLKELGQALRKVVCLWVVRVLRAIVVK
jgi:hypothetical protein